MSNTSTRGVSRRSATHEFAVGQAGLRGVPSGILLPMRKIRRRRQHGRPPLAIAKE